MATPQVSLVIVAEDDDLGAPTPFWHAPAKALLQATSRQRGRFSAKRTQKTENNLFSPETLAQSS